MILNKYSSIKTDQEKRISNLSTQINIQKEQAQYIEYHHEIIDKLILIIQT